MPTPNYTNFTPWTDSSSYANYGVTSTYQAQPNVTPVTVSSATTTAKTGGDPFAAAGVISAAAGALLAMQSAYNQTALLKLNLKHAARMSELNMEIAQMQAQDALRKGEYDAAKLGAQFKAEQGKNRNAWAAMGVDVNYGDPVRIAASDRAMYDYDRRRIIDNAINQGFGYRIQAINQQGDAALKAGMASAVSPAYSALTTGYLTSATVAAKWYESYGSSVVQSVGEKVKMVRPKETATSTLTTDMWSN